MFLAGDIGGTKIDLCIFSRADRSNVPVIHAEGTFRSDDAESLESLVSDYLSTEKIDIVEAVFAVAGPVIDGQSDITNLPWVIREDRLKQRLNIPSISLINDLQAAAYNIPYLEPDETYILNSGVRTQGNNIGVVAPGTGLGESFLTPTDTGHAAHACEGGHGDFAPTRDIEVRLLNYLSGIHGHVSIERVCSGMGLRDIYRFLRDAEGIEEPDWLAHMLDGIVDPAPVIIHTASDDAQSSELCDRTLDIFSAVLGAEAGNLALKVMATGGIYLGGGIPPRILRILDNGRFMDSFTNKGRMSSLLADIPVHVILNPQAALHGATHMALNS